MAKPLMVALSRCWTYMSVRLLLTGGIVLILWLVVFACVRLTSDLVPIMGWIELLNGATWPTNWHDLRRSSPNAFSAILATRTILNSMGPVAVVAGVVWFIVLGWGRLMQMTLIELLRMHNVELVSALADTLRRRHQLSEADVEDMQAAAQRFFDDWQHELKNVGPDQLPSHGR